MQKIKVNDYVIAFRADQMGTMIQKGTYRQVGTLRTLYVYPEGNVSRSQTVIVEHVKTGDLYEIEQHRGLAISALIRDEEMLKAMKEHMKTLAEDEMFVYDQEMRYSTEEIEREKIQPIVDSVVEADE